jgi:hypothetical protein
VSLTPEWPLNWCQRARKGAGGHFREGGGMGTTVQVKCLLRNGVLLLLLVNAWVHCTLTVVQRGERAEFTSSSTVARSLSLLSLVLTTLFLQRERECAAVSLSRERERVPRWCTHCTVRRESRVCRHQDRRSISPFLSTHCIRAGQTILRT